MQGFEAYTHDDDGNPVLPESQDDWGEWVSAGRTRNYCNDETLVDWLGLYGQEHGFQPDEEYPGYDPDLAFGPYLMGQGQRFEAAVLRHIETLHPVTRIGTGFEQPWEAVRSLDAARETFDAMCRGDVLISQGVLRNPSDRTYGGADLLVRSDILRELFPDAISEFEARMPAPGIGATRWHYRVIDIKFTTLKLRKDGSAAADHRAYMVQVFIYSQALARIQGYAPPAAYILGRAWQENGDRGTNCMDRLAVVPTYHAINGIPIAQTAAEAVAWVRRVRTEGAGWSVRPRPSVPELLPCNGTNHSWTKAVKAIGDATDDVTLLWQVGKAARVTAHANGVFSWRDPGCHPGVFDLNPGHVAGHTLLRELNLDTDGPALRPDRIHAGADVWGRPGPVEFYVDFEWSNGLNDDFARVPEQNGSSIIFMIGCGHTEDGEWKFASFVADDLGDDAEARIIDQWFEHMAAVTARLAPGTSPLVFHWSPAEDRALSSQWNSARSRHPEKTWPNPRFYDFLGNVIREEPVGIRGAMAFGLKPFATAMHANGFIDTLWGDSVVDGMGAMIGAWRAADEARALRCTLADVPIMASIRDYNEVDCKVMMEIVRCLRQRVVLP